MAAYQVHRVSVVLSSTDKNSPPFDQTSGGEIRPVTLYVSRNLQYWWCVVWWEE
jgi:hypothetical protein